MHDKTVPEPVAALSFKRDSGAGMWVSLMCSHDDGQQTGLHSHNLIGSATFDLSLNNIHLGKQSAPIYIV